MFAEYHPTIETLAFLFPLSSQTIRSRPKSTLSPQRLRAHRHRRRRSSSIPMHGPRLLRWRRRWRLSSYTRRQFWRCLRRHWSRLYCWWWWTLNMSLSYTASACSAIMLSSSRCPLLLPFQRRMLIEKILKPCLNFILVFKALCSRTSGIEFVCVFFFEGIGVACA